MDDQEREADILLAALNQIIGKGMVTGFAIVASFLDEDGDQRIYGNCMNDQRCHATMGLLDYGLAVERARAVESHNG
jgi:hypothetical protein